MTMASERVDSSGGSREGPAGATARSLKASIGHFLNEMNQRGVLSSPSPPHTLTNLAKMTTVAPSTVDLGEANAALRAALAAAHEKIATLQAALDDEKRRHKETRAALKNSLIQSSINSIVGEVTKKDAQEEAEQQCSSSPSALGQTVTSLLVSPPQPVVAPGDSDGGQGSSSRRHRSDHRHLEQLLDVVQTRLQQQTTPSSKTDALITARQILSPSGGRSPRRASSSTPGRVVNSPRHVGFGHGEPRFKDFVQVGDQTVFADAASRRSNGLASGGSRDKSPGASTRAAQLRHFLHASTASPTW